jgi:anthranilate synthase component 1
MTPESFESCVKKGFNRIPVTREIPADLDTPLSVYLKLASEPWSFLFESVEGGERWGRYSIIGLAASRRFQVRGRLCEVYEGDRCLSAMEQDNPLQWVSEIQSRYRAPVVQGLPAFTGGLVGYFGYDTVRYVEPRLAANVPEDDQGLPDILLFETSDLVVFDNLRSRMLIVTHADGSQSWEKAHAHLEDIEQRLRTLSAEEPHNPDPDQPLEITTDYGQTAYEANVERIREYILAGDCMQVVLSQRMSGNFGGHPLNLYRALRSLNPSPYMFYLNCGDFQVVGSSPEILARSEAGKVTVRPIAGTRHRGRNLQEDQALEQELLADPKERAEHLMLIDLGRNDVGRVATTGSVEVTEQMVVERYSHVMHIVSSVTGQLNPALGAMDVLAATLPAGTLSGAPKVRAMEIIDELEPTKRGIYGGAVGYLGWHGNMDTAIAIRTAVVSKGQLVVQAGAGVVADSVPESEWQETLNKAGAVLSAARKALSDFS